MSKEDFEEIFNDIEQLKNLSLLQEDYFYSCIGDTNFNKHATLASTIVEKIRNIDIKLTNLYSSNRKGSK